MTTHRIRYQSYARFRHDLEATLRHGGTVLPGGVDDLEPNTMIELGFELPDGASFTLEARTGQPVPNVGRMVVFEPSAAEVVQQMAAHVENAPDDEDVEPELLSGAVDDEPERAPEPGDVIPIFVVKYSTLGSFLRVVPGLEAGRLVLPHAAEDAAPGSACKLRLILPGHNVFEMGARLLERDPATVTLEVATDDAALRKALLHPDSHHGRTRLQGETEEDTEALCEVLRLEDRIPEEDDKIPLRTRIRRMGMEEKINLALSGDREMRMALASDTNRAIHHYLLKNSRITLEEIGFMARQPTMNPDVLSKIAENRVYARNSLIAKGLVFNPKTPISIAIRLLDRLGRGDLMSIARRHNMDKRLVMAAKKKLGE